MKIKPKEVRRTVGILSDPQPSFMSIVDHGANQVPFNVVKHARNPKEKSPMTVKRKATSGNAPNRAARRKSAATAKKSTRTASKGASQDAKLVRLNFSKTNFATKADVKKYLEKLLPSDGYTITDDNDVWAVKSTEDMSDLRLGKAKSTTTKSAGVTAFVAPVLGEAEDGEEESTQKKGGSKVKDVAGKARKSDDEDEDDDDGEEDDDADDEDADDDADGDEDEDSDDEDDDADEDGDDDDDEDTDNVLGMPITHEPQLLDTKKYDWYGAYLSGNDSLVGVLKDGLSYDALPPGLGEVNEAALIAAGNILGGDDDAATKKTKLAQLGAEFGNFIYGLHEVFDQATEDATKSASSKRRKSAKAYVESFTKSVDEASGNVTGDDEDDADADGTGEKKPRAKSNKSNAEESAWDKISKRLDRLDRTLSRRTSRKGMSDSLEELGIEAEEDEEADEQHEIAKSDMRRALGGK